MIRYLPTQAIAGINEFKRAPLSHLQDADGFLTVFQYANPVFYCISLEKFDELIAKKETSHFSPHKVMMPIESEALKELFKILFKD